MTLLCLEFRATETVIMDFVLKCGDMQTSTATMENSVEIPYKTGNRTAIQSSNPTAGHTHRGNQN